MILNNMNKQQIDKVITREWTNLHNKTETFVRNAKTTVEMDVTTFAYEMCIKNSDKIITEIDVTKFFLRYVKMAAVWTNSEYFKEYKTKDLYVGDDSILAYFDNQIEEEMEIIDTDILDGFIKTLTIQEKMTINWMLIGYDTSGKLSRVTTIPRTTCYYLIKNIKDKLKEYYDLQN